MWKRLCEDFGATSVEYAIMVMTIAAVVVVGATALGLATVPLFAAPLRGFVGA